MGPSRVKIYARMIGTLFGQSLWSLPMPSLIDLGVIASLVLWVLLVALPWRW